MARPNSIAGLPPEGIVSAIQAGCGLPRWRGSVFPFRGILRLGLKDVTGQWVSRSTGMPDTPENRTKARSVLDDLRARYALIQLPSRKRTKSNGRNSSFKRRRGETCEVCGWRSRPPLRDTAVNAHHVTPRSEGGDDSDANRIVLCPNHHAVAHALHRESAAADRADLLARLKEWDARATRLGAVG